MPLFDLQVFKTHPLSGRPFSNTYIVSATDIATAMVGSDDIVDNERTIFDDSTLFTYVRISTHAAGDNVFSTRVYNQNGTNVTGTPLALFNTIRVDVDTTDLGRPSRFHYRTLHENEVSGLNIDPAVLSAVADMWAAMMTALSSDGCTLVQGDGSVLDTVHVHPLVVQRSLHRKRRKRNF